MRNGHWYAEIITIKSDPKTILNIMQLKYQIPLNPAYFTTAFLEAGRTKKA